jgi:hypothetical protein
MARSAAPYENTTPKAPFLALVVRMLPFFSPKLPDDPPPHGFRLGGFPIGEEDAPGLRHALVTDGEQDQKAVRPDGQEAGLLRKFHGRAGRNGAGGNGAVQACGASTVSAVFVGCCGTRNEALDRHSSVDLRLGQSRGDLDPLSNPGIVVKPIDEKHPSAKGDTAKDDGCDFHGLTACTFQGRASISAR